MKTLLFAALLSLAAVPALAQNETSPTATRYKKRTLIDMTSVNVQGAVTRPDHAYLLIVNGARFRSLVRARSTFLPELDTSIYAL